MIFVALPHDRRMLHCINTNARRMRLAGNSHWRDAHAHCMGPSPHAIRTRQIPPSAGSFFAWRLDSRARLRPGLCDLKGPAGAGRGLGKCPPAPAVGRHLLLYFAQTPTCPDEARLAAPGAQIAAFLRPPKISARRAEALACEVKGEAVAAGRRRRTFARKGLRPALRRMDQPRATQERSAPAIAVPVLVPRLEHQHVPQVRMPFALAAQERLPDRAHAYRIEASLVAQ